MKEMSNEMINEMLMEAVTSTTESPEKEVGKTEGGKTYSLRVHKGYSQTQMNSVYRHCKNRDLFIAKPVLELMYNWADKYEAEQNSEMEELRQAACKVVCCIFVGNYKAAQSKVRFIESVLKKQQPKVA